MERSVFKFKQFDIDQSDVSFKVGTDGCLLGAWAPISGVKRALDVGTGSGLIALMLAQRSSAQITGIDIQAHHAAQAAHNFAHSPWTERLEARHVSLQDYAAEQAQLFDLIVCNPPFFSQSLLGQNHQKNIARHSVSLEIDELMALSKVLIQPTGKLAMIIPVASLEKAIEGAKSLNWHLQEQVMLQSLAHKAPHRAMLVFALETGPTRESQFVIEKERGVYTSSVHELLEPFLIKL
jgi:tRNA1Val (adenine37-N6)-methyltransferase